MWNLYTPLKRYCGCVATAARQVMAYFQWPRGTVTPGNVYAKATGVEGIGGWHVEYGYQATAEQAEAGEYTPWEVPFGGEYDDAFWMDVASGNASAMSRLVRDIGVASYMTYGSDGNSATSPDVHKAFYQTFQYANAKICGSKPEAVWKTTILSNLAAKRPVMVEAWADGYWPDGSQTASAVLGKTAATPRSRSPTARRASSRTCATRATAP